MDIPKKSLADKEIKIKHTQERKVKHLDSLYSTGFLNNYFSHTNSHQSNNKHS